MGKEFEVRWEGELPGSPQDVWDAITKHAAGWVWEIDYEPRVGGAERGLTSGGGKVTRWDPPRHFATLSNDEENHLDYVLASRGSGTYLRYVHSGEWHEDYDQTLDACRAHTEFYLHSMGEYVGHFAGREPAYVEIDPPGSFAAVCDRLGLPKGAAVGDRVRLATGVEGTVDYLTDSFLGVRTADSLVRVYGRERWDAPLNVALHLFGDEADPAEAERAWSARLDNTTEAVA